MFFFSFLFFCLCVAHCIRLDGLSAGEKMRIRNRSSKGIAADTHRGERRRRRRPPLRHTRFEMTAKKRNIRKWLLCSIYPLYATALLSWKFLFIYAKKKKKKKKKFPRLLLLFFFFFFPIRFERVQRRKGNLWFQSGKERRRISIKMGSGLLHKRIYIRAYRYFFLFSHNNQTV